MSNDVDEPLVTAGESGAETAAQSGAQLADERARSRRGLEQTLTTIAETVRISLPGFDEVSISTIDSQGNVLTRAGTGDLVRDLDQLQYALGEGPCMDSARGAPLMVVSSIEQDPRWPRYARAAVEKGVRSLLSVPLKLGGGRTLGTLNIYSTTRDEVDPAAEVIAERFAAYIVIALESDPEPDGLGEALSSRKLTGQAMGLLMSRHQLTEDAAYAVLVKRSERANLKVHEVAAEMVRVSDATGLAVPGAAF